MTVTANDFNGDGASDVFWTTWGGVLGFYLTDLSHPFPPSPILVNTMGHIVGSGDFDGDGEAEVLYVDPAFGPLIYDFDIVGSFVNTFVIGLEDYTKSGSPEWTIVGIGDFDGSGDAEFVSRHETTGAIGVVEISGNQISGGVVGGASLDWEVVATGDFTGDGTDDILWRNTTTGVVGTFEMDNGWPSWRPFEAVTLDWEIAGTGDFDGDGVDEILFRHTVDGRIGALDVSGGSVSREAIGAVDNVRFIADTGDYNGDGFDDILVRNTNLQFDPIGYLAMDDGEIGSFEYLGDLSDIHDVHNHLVDDFMF